MSRKVPYLERCVGERGAVVVNADATKVVIPGAHGEERDGAGGRGAGREREGACQAERTACGDSREVMVSLLEGDRFIDLSVCGSRSQAKDHSERTVRRCARPA